MRTITYAGIGASAVIDMLSFFVKVQTKLKYLF